MKYKLAEILGIIKSNNSLKLFLIILAVCLLILLIIALDSRLYVRKYIIDSEKISAKIRIALVSDLHSSKYGENQSELLSAIDENAPDMVVLVGDIFDHVLSDKNSKDFLAGISEKYPCYYVTGNHEYYSDSEYFREKMSVIEGYGIKRLSGEYETVSIKGETFNICGVDDPVANVDVSLPFSEQLQKVNSAAQNGRYTVLLSHRPEYFETYGKYDFDLVLCGHAHGGQWRIPYILNGVFAPDQGLFPKYAGGEYKKDSMTMIVSRGLSLKHYLVPRIFNRPELVIIDIE